MNGHAFLLEIPLNYLTFLSNLKQTSDAALDYLLIISHSLEEVSDALR